MRGHTGTATRKVAALVGAGLLAAVLGGCASASNADVSAVATRFEDPSGDVQARCDLLAPATRSSLEQDGPCAQALSQVTLHGGAVRSVEVWGGSAQVRLRGDTVFLNQTDAGWRVTAAGCTPRTQAPYECEVEGP